MVVMRTGGLLVFSTASDRSRYTVTCIINQGDVSVVDTIVDTGAICTCYKAEQISDTLKEESFIGGEYRFLGGFVDGQDGFNAVKFYKLNVKQFTIGTIDLGARSVWITFDKRISDNVLGMDILRGVSFLQYDRQDEICFFKDREELRDYVNNQ